MSNDSTEPEKSPFTSRGFIAAAIVIAVIVVMGAVLGVQAIIRATNPTEPPPDSTSSPTVAPSTEPSADAGDGGVCAMPGSSDADTLAAPPEAEWEYQGTIAYPTSEQFGPSETAAEGYRLCYQQSVEGALFAAANSVSLSSDPATREAWLDYAIAEGPYRDAILNASSEPSSGVRMNIAGFRVLDYTGDTATIDIAISGSAEGQTLVLSSIYELVWVDGDWRFELVNGETGFDVSMIPNLAGYVTWGP